MPQTLFPRDFPEGIVFVRTFTGTSQIHIGELPGNAGYARIDGQPIQSVGELTAVIPAGPRLQQALDWWQHHDDEEPEWEPPAVTWKKGRLVYVETGAELTSHAEIIEAFPEESPMQRAALEWFGQRQQAQQASHRQAGATGVLATLNPELGKPTEAKRSHHKQGPSTPKVKGKPGPKPKNPLEQPAAIARGILSHDKTVATGVTAG